MLVLTNTLTSKRMFKIVIINNQISNLLVYDESSQPYFDENGVFEYTSTQVHFWWQKN